MPGPVVDAEKPVSAPPPAGSPLDRYFRIAERGSTPGREIRGGFATFFTMAYILVLNPIILHGATDKFAIIGKPFSRVELAQQVQLAMRKA